MGGHQEMCVSWGGGARRGARARAEGLSKHLSLMGCLLKYLLQEAPAQRLHGLNCFSTSGIKYSSGFSILKGVNIQGKLLLSLWELPCLCIKVPWYQTFRLLTFSPRRKAPESPWTLTSVSGHSFYPFVCSSACLILYVSLHAVLSSRCWGRSRVYMLGRTEGRGSLHLCGYEGILSVLVKTLQCSCWELPCFCQ